MKIRRAPRPRAIDVAEHLAFGPAGDCVVTRLDDGRLRIEHADPRVMISGQLLEEIDYDPAPGVSREGDLLRIEGVNRTVIYRIGEKVSDRYAYYAEWPD